MERTGAVPGSGVRPGRLHGQLRAGEDPMLRQRGADLRRDRPVGSKPELRPGLRRRTLRRRMPAGRAGLPGDPTTAVQRVRALGSRRRTLLQRLHRWCLHRRMQPPRHSVRIGHARADMHPDRAMGGGHPLPVRLRERELRRAVRAGNERVPGRAAQHGVSHLQHHRNMERPCAVRLRVYGCRPMWRRMQPRRARLLEQRAPGLLERRPLAGPARLLGGDARVPGRPVPVPARNGPLQWIAAAAVHRQQPMGQRGCGLFQLHGRPLPGGRVQRRPTRAVRRCRLRVCEQQLLRRVLRQSGGGRLHGRAANGLRRPQLRLRGRWLRRWLLHRPWLYGPRNRGLPQVRLPMRPSPVRGRALRIVSR
jgi:hypothetical protein